MKITSFRFWLHGLMAATIGGGANAITLIVVDPLKFNLEEGWKNLLTAVIVSGLVSAALYLKQSPMPPETDGKKAGGGAMMLIFAMLFVVSGLPFQGCSSVRTADASQINTAAASIKFAVSQGLGPVLANNPEYVGAVQAIAMGISGVLAIDGGVTGASAKEFVAGVSKRYPLDERTQAIICGVIVDAYQFYVDAYRPKVAAGLDPNVVQLIKGFQAGVEQAVARVTP